MKPDKEQVWHEVLQSVRVSVSSATYSTWLSQTHLSSLRKLDSNRYLADIGCESTFVKATVEKRYFGLLQDALIKSVGVPCDLTFTVKALEGNMSKAQAKEQPSNMNPLFESEEQKEELMGKIAKAQIRPGFTFENYAVSSSNQMAHAAALAVADTPGTSYNPLFIWGGVGVGKTHIMHAVGHKYLSRSNMKVLACTGEDFTNDIVEGIRNKTTQAFREKYRKLQGLFIDDIQFIAGKDSVQEEFFHTFNAVLSAGGQIIMTADKPPREITKLEERLLSRFEAGLVVDIDAPDFELRCAIIKIKAEEKNINIDDDIVQLLAGNVESARTLEGYLTRIMSESKIKNKPIDADLITSILGKAAGDEERKIKASPDNIIDAICNHYSIGKRALLGKGRSKMASHPRQVLMYILRTELKLPLEEVGRLVGRDHSTVIHGVDKITQMASGNVDIREDISRIKGFL